MKKFFCFIFLGCLFLFPLNLHGIGGWGDDNLAQLVDEAVNVFKAQEALEEGVLKKSTFLISEKEFNECVSLVRKLSEPLVFLAEFMVDDFYHVSVCDKKSVMSMFLDMFFTYKQMIDVSFMAKLVDIARQNQNNTFERKLWWRQDAALAEKEGRQKLSSTQQQ